MPAQITRALIGPQYHGHGVPADQRANSALHEQAVAAGSFGEPFENVLGAINALLFDQRLQRIQPFTGLYGIIVLVHQTSPWH